MKSKEKLSLKNVEKALKEEREKLVTLLNSIEITPTLASGDLADQSSHLSDEHTSFAIRDRTLKRIDQIDSALLRVKTPDYGICVTCQEEIEVKRLIHVPTTSLCVECQQLSERNNR